MLQIAVNENLQIFQLDVKSAYLNAEIDHEIYLQQPKGFIKYDEKGNPLVLKLNKSLYGLKQSGRMWNNLLHNFLTDIDFVQSEADHCVYVCNKNNCKIFLIVWVDDIIIASSSLDVTNSVKQMLANRFKMKDFGYISYFLGIEFEISKNSMKMHQEKYIQKILEKFKMFDCNPKLIPCDLNTVNLDFHDQSPLLSDPKLYREIVVSLIYLMTCTRPDICYIVTILSQYLCKPTMAHFNLAKHVLRYLKGTISQGLIFNCEGNKCLEGFTDASWANSDGRKSISGYCFRLSNMSALISWKSKKQSTVALSTCEAEYISMTHGIQEGIFLKQLLVDMLVFCNEDPVVLFVDNKGAIDLGKNPVHHQRSKHIDIKYHFIRSKIQDGQFVLKYVPSKDNIADIFTKPSTRLSLEQFKVTKV